MKGTYIKKKVRRKWHLFILHIFTVHKVQIIWCRKECKQIRNYLRKKPVSNFVQFVFFSGLVNYWPGYFRRKNTKKHLFYNFSISCTHHVCLEQCILLFKVYSLQQNWMVKYSIFLQPRATSLTLTMYFIYKSIVIMMWI